MDIQQVLTATLYVIIISFLALITYCEVAVSSNKALQTAELHQQQTEELKNNTVLKKQSPPIENRETQTTTPPATEDMPAPTKTRQEIDFNKVSLQELRKECSQANIKWRSAVIDIKTGKRRSLRKAEIVAALQQKLSA